MIRLLYLHIFPTQIAINFFANQPVVLHFDIDMSKQNRFYSGRVPYIAVNRDPLYVIIVCKPRQNTICIHCFGAKGLLMIYRIGFCQLGGFPRGNAAYRIAW